MNQANIEVYEINLLINQHSDLGQDFNSHPRGLKAKGCSKFRGRQLHQRPLPDVHITLICHRFDELRPIIFYRLQLEVKSRIPNTSVYVWNTKPQFTHTLPKSLESILHLDGSFSKAIDLTCKNWNYSRFDLMNELSTNGQDNMTHFVLCLSAEWAPQRDYHTKQITDFWRSFSLDNWLEVTNTTIWHAILHW
jgi:hypothetical protein